MGNKLIGRNTGFNCASKALVDTKGRWVATSRMGISKHTPQLLLSDKFREREEEREKKLTVEDEQQVPLRENSTATFPLASRHSTIPSRLPTPAKS